MPNPLIRIHNTEIGDEVIDREMTAEELMQLKNYAERQAIEAEKAEAEAKATAKAALLAQLGITEEQAKLLLS
jgi:hypothetical protein